MFIDKVLDKLYLCGVKENGIYNLTLTQATEVANQLFDEFQLINKLPIIKVMQQELIKRDSNIIQGTSEDTFYNGFISCYKWIINCVK